MLANRVVYQIRRGRDGLPRVVRIRARKNAEELGKPLGVSVNLWPGMVAPDVT